MSGWVPSFLSLADVVPDLMMIRGIIPEERSTAGQLDSLDGIVSSVLLCHAPCSITFGTGIWRLVMVQHTLSE